jgi:hypothetical protein
MNRSHSVRSEAIPILLGPHASFRFIRAASTATRSRLILLNFSARRSPQTTEFPRINSTFSNTNKTDLHRPLCAKCVFASGQEASYGPESTADYCADRALGSFASKSCATSRGVRAKYHDQTIHGPFREAQRFLDPRLQQRYSGRVSRAAVMSLNQLLDQLSTGSMQGKKRLS